MTGNRLFFLFHWIKPVKCPRGVYTCHMTGGSDHYSWITGCSTKFLTYWDQSCLRIKSCQNLSSDHCSTELVSFRFISTCNAAVCSTTSMTFSLQTKLLTTLPVLMMVFVEEDRGKSYDVYPLVERILLMLTSDVAVNFLLFIFVDKRYLIPTTIQLFVPCQRWQKKATPLGVRHTTMSKDSFRRCS